jgi:hypothetical protein
LDGGGSQPLRSIERMGDAGGVRNSWSWGLPSYKPFDTEYDIGKDDIPAAPVFVPQSPSRGGMRRHDDYVVPKSPSRDGGGRRHDDIPAAPVFVPQSPSLGGRRHSMSAAHPPDTPRQRMQSASFVSKVLKVKDRISVSPHHQCCLIRFSSFLSARYIYPKTVRDMHTRPSRLNT